MNQAENNGIDVLLRGLGQAERAAARKGHESNRQDSLEAKSAHLDADELNSYAEGVLPAAARGRYTAHLAECDNCRRMLAQLSLAVGPLIKERSAVQNSALAWSWRQRLVLLFSPRVLRYAMPALGAIAVLTVGIYVWRQSRNTSLVAVNERTAVSGDTKTPGPQDEESRGFARNVAENNGEVAHKKEQKLSPSQPSVAKAEAKKDGKTETSSTPAAAPAKGGEKDSAKNE